jgi:hypothetical protein
LLPSSSLLQGHSATLRKHVLRQSFAARVSGLQKDKAQWMRAHKSKERRFKINYSKLIVDESRIGVPNADYRAGSELGFLNSI